MKVTKQLLLDHGACSDQVDLFEKIWPDGAELTRDNLLKAYEWEWIVDERRMSHYRRRKDKTELSSTFKLPIEGSQYLRFYIWNSTDAMAANVLHGGDPEWFRGMYLACYLDIGGAFANLYGEIHLTLEHLGVGVVAHELMHFIFSWIQTIEEIEDEEVCTLMGELNRKFWLAYYDRYEEAK